MSIANKIVVGLVGLTVMAVIFGAMLPIMGEVTSAEDTFTNEGYFRVSKITENTDITISWTYEAPKTVTVGDTTASLDNIPVDLQVTIVGTDDCVTRYQNYAGGTAQRIQSYSDTMGYTAVASTTGNSGVFSVIINGFNLTYNHNGGQDKTSTITSGFYIDPNGDYIMKYSTESAYILKDTSIIMLSGVTNPIGLYAEGTLEDGIDINDVYVSGLTNVTFGDVTYNYSNVDNYIGLVKLTSCVFDISYVNDDTPSTITATYSYFVVPYEITAEKSIHPDGPTTAILNMLPIIVGAGLLLGAIAFMIVKRK